MMDWWKQAAVANPEASEIGVITRMITQAISDTDDAHRKTAAVFANTLGMDDLAARIPGLVQTRTIKADIAESVKLSANKEMPAVYRAIDWTTAWKTGDTNIGAAIFKKRGIACHDSGRGAASSCLLWRASRNGSRHSTWLTRLRHRARMFRRTSTRGRSFKSTANFSLGQDRKQLVLRLQTRPVNSKKAPREQPLCELTDTAPHHVLIT